MRERESGAIGPPLSPVDHCTRDSNILIYSIPGVINDPLLLVMGVSARCPYLCFEAPAGPPFWGNSLSELWFSIGFIITDVSTQVEIRTLLGHSQ